MEPQTDGTVFYADRTDVDGLAMYGLLQHPCIRRAIGHQIISPHILCDDLSPALRRMKLCWTHHIRFLARSSRTRTPYQWSLSRPVAASAATTSFRYC